MSENICIINAKSGIGTSSPQISQFTHNCDSVKFVINKDLTNFALVLISSINGDVSVLSEGEFLTKSYNLEASETTVLWYPTSEITKESGCVLYQLAAFDAVSKETIWYSKEGRLIVTDSIDTDDYSAAQVGSQTNLVTQILTLAKSLELEINTLSENKVDKSEGKMLSSNDFTDEHIEKLDEAHSTAFKNTDLIDNMQLSLDKKGESISELDERMNLAEGEIDSLRIIANENAPEESYNPQSQKAQSGKAVARAIASIVNSAPETLNTLEELAKALGNDPNFATTIMTLLGGKVDKKSGKDLSSNDYTDEERQKLQLVYGESDRARDDIDQLDTRVNYAEDALKETKEILNSHILNTENPHSVTKEQIGLGNADNTSDINKPVSAAMQKALDAKVSVADYNSDIAEFEADINNKLDKEDGKVLSSNDFTDELKSKLDNLDGEIGGYLDHINEPLEAITTPLLPNKQYILGEMETLSLIFPSSASAGDVVYLTFLSGNVETNLSIDTTNTCDIEIIPEKNTGYEIFGKFTGSLWIVNYSEFIVSGG